ncbi:hypothetical protein KIPB_004947, partial [Kipferlia bialata]
RITNFIEGCDDVAPGYSNEVRAEDDAILHRHNEALQAMPLGSLGHLATDAQVDAGLKCLALLRAGRIEEYLQYGLPAMVESGLTQAGWDVAV